MSSNLDVVIGSGVLGRTLARELSARGRAVRLLNRHGGRFEGLEATACDVGDPLALGAVVDGAARVYLCAAPPYARWEQEFPRLVEGLCAAVRGRGIDVVYGDNLYAYGDVQGPLREGMAESARTRKGRVRAAVAARLRALQADGGARCCIVRAADFFGPGVENSVVGARVVKAVLAGSPAYLLGDPDQPHSLTYLPDQVRCMIELAGRADAYGHTWHAPNASAQSLRAFVTALAEAGRAPPPRLRVAGRLLLRTMGLFKPDMRELVEMLYQFERPFVVDDSALRQRFGLAPTPMAEALRETAAWAAG